MSKELSPLEALEKIGYDYYKYSDRKGRYETVNETEEYGIIETALKEYEKPKKIVDSISFEQSIENYVKNNCPSITKKLRAFEIVVEKEVNIHNFKFITNTLFWDYKDFSRESKEYKQGIALKHLTQEEFDLLKEELE